MSIMKNFNKTYLIGILILAIGIFIGATLFSSKNQQEDNHKHLVEQTDKTVWTCSMHPQIRQDEAGNCPICGMDLIPNHQVEADIDQDAIRMSKSARKLAQIETSIVGKMNNSSNLYFSGRLDINQNQTQSISANFKARIDQLYINEEGERIKRGEVIAELYAPEIEILKNEWSLAKQQQNVTLLKSIKRKINNYELSVSDIETSSNGLIKLKSSKTGFVTNLNIQQGDNVKIDQVLLSITDLSSLWAIIDVYEQDLNSIQVGDKVIIKTSSRSNIKGEISFISPVLDKNTRALQARIVVNNQDLKLKPGVFISANLVDSKLNSTPEEKLMIPKSAVLWTGKRSVVYKQLENNRGVYFMMKEVEIGKTSSGFIEILSGLESGDKIVTRGAFTIDSEAQLANKPSMMNPKGDVLHSDHNHATMIMDNESNNQNLDQIDLDKKLYLEELFESYFDLKNTLVLDDFESSIMFYKYLNDKFLQMGLQNYSSADDFKTIEDLRKEFKKISEVLINKVKTTNPYASKVYIQQCPMAYQGDGAEWLSLSDQVENPYYGASMLKCGAVILEVD